MTRRQRNIGILALIFLTILILLILLLLRFRPEPSTVEPVITPDVPSVEQTVPVRSPIEQQQAEERETTASVQTVAKTFATRYGSYSNEADFQNLRDLYPLMTTDFQLETENFIADTTIPENYYGITTRVITLKMDAYDEAAGTATVTITTQREEAIDSPQNINIRYQDIVMTLEQVSGTWKIASAQWK